MTAPDDSVELRRAVQEDAVAIARVQIETWRAAYHGLVPDAYLNAMTVDTRSAGWPELLRAVAPDRRPFVATVGAEIVGFVAMGAARDDPTAPDGSTASRDPGSGEVYAIYVARDHWRSGIGRALLAQAERDLSHSFDQAVLWCLTANARARLFYEHEGWRADGATKTRDFDGTSVDEVRYRKLLASSPADDPA